MNSSEWQTKVHPKMAVKLVDDWCGQPILLLYCMIRYSPSFK